MKLTEVESSLVVVKVTQLPSDKLSVSEDSETKYPETPEVSSEAERFRVTSVLDVEESPELI